MSIHDNLGNIVDSIDKMFRYLVPGFVFVAFLRIFHHATFFEYFGKCREEIDLALVSLSIPFIGFVVYAVHRAIFECVDYMLCNFNYKKYRELVRNSHWLEADLRSDIFNKMGLIHFSIMFSEMLIIFNCTSDVQWLKDPCYPFFPHCKCCILVVGVTLLIVLFCQYRLWHRMQRNYIGYE